MSSKICIFAVKIVIKMKKFFKTFSVFLLVAGMCMVWCGICSSCSSDEYMYETNKKRSKVIHSNYKVRGTNNNNSSTYRTY